MLRYATIPPVVNTHARTCLEIHPHTYRAYRTHARTQMKGLVPAQLTQVMLQVVMDPYLDVVHSGSALPSAFAMTSLAACATLSCPYRANFCIVVELAFFQHCHLVGGD